MIITLRDGTDITSVTGSLNGAYTVIKTAGVTGRRAAIAYFENSAAGTEIITLTAAASDANLGVTGFRVSGLRTTGGPDDSSNTGNNQSVTSHPFGAITTTGA